ncbi:heterokaryon incompatibility, partial [Rhizodiscina lignyota]
MADHSSSPSPRSSNLSAVTRFAWGDFEALSYTWGNQTSTQQIIMNGKIWNVSENLENALRALLLRPETRNGMHYWIDALCINQADEDERNHQVKRMQTIYSDARAVVVWVGEPKEHEYKASQFLYEVNRVVLQEPDGPPSFLYDLGQEVLQETESFFRKPYWQRLWIIQELAVNHHSTL